MPPITTAITVVIRPMPIELISAEVKMLPGEDALVVLEGDLAPESACRP